jgi:hypothetical protein
MYFCRMNLSIAESASSASNGMGGLALVGLYIRFEAMFPTRFIFYSEVRHRQPAVDWTASHTSTCSFVQESMLSDLTFVMCVPNFRCRAAHRMQRNIPNWTKSVHTHTHTHAHIIQSESSNEALCQGDSYTPTCPSCRTVVSITLPSTYTAA